MLKNICLIFVELSQNYISVISTFSKNICSCHLNIVCWIYLYNSKLFIKYIQCFFLFLLKIYSYNIFYFFFTKYIHDICLFWKLNIFTFKNLVKPIWTIFVLVTFYIILSFKSSLETYLIYLFFSKIYLRFWFFVVALFSPLLFRFTKDVI